MKIKLWFDAASGLLIKEEFPAGNGRKTFEYSDFRAINGVIEPFAIKLSAGEDQYKEILGEKHSAPAAALRAAQVSMWRDPRWRSPFYWAAFVLQGEW